MSVIFIIGSLIVPAIYLLDGFILWKYPPEYPGSGKIRRRFSLRSGYRSQRARLNEDTWSFTQHYCGVLWIRLGAVLAALGIVGIVFELSVPEESGAVICLCLIVVQILCLPVTFIPIEGRLKRTFTETGERRVPRETDAGTDAQRETEPAGNEPDPAENEPEPAGNEPEETGDEADGAGEETEEKESGDGEGPGEAQSGGEPGPAYKPGRRKKKKNRE